MTLPYISLSWTAPTPPGGVEFRRYQIYRDGQRLVLPAGQVAALSNIGTLTYDDYLASPSVEHTYAVSWVGEQDGIEVESVLTPATAELAFPARGGWLHNVDDPSKAVHLLATSLRRVPRMEQRWLRPRNRQAETLYSGRLYAHDLQITLAPEQVRTAPVWDALDAMAEAQASSDATYCLRLSFRPGARYFVQLTDLGEGLRPALSETSLALRETHYGEAV